MKLFGGKRQTTASAHRHVSPSKTKVSNSAASQQSVAATKTVIHTTAQLRDGQDDKQDVVTDEINHDDARSLEVAIEERQQLEQQVDQLNEQYGTARGHLRSKLLTEKDLLRSQSRRVNRLYEVASEQRKDHFEMFGKLQAKRTALLAQIKQNDAHRQELQQSCEKHDRTLRMLQAQLATVKKERQSLSDQEHALIGAINTQSNLTDMMSVINDKRQQITAINAQDHDLKLTLSGLNTSAAQEQATIDKLHHQIQLAAQQAADNQQIIDLKHQVEVLTTQLSDKHKQLSKDDEKLGELRSQKNVLSQSFDELADRMKFYFNSTKVIDTYNFDPKRHYVLYSNTLLPLGQLNGEFSLQRIDQLFDNTRTKYDILTTDFNRELGSIWATYQSQGILRHAHDLINPYLAMQHDGRHQAHQTDVVLPLDQAQEWQVEEGTREQPEKIKSKTGSQVVTLQYRTDRSLSSVMYYQDKQLYKMAIYDAQNVLLATQYADPHDATKAASEIYYRPDHSVALEKVYFPDHVVVQSTEDAKIVEHAFDTEASFYEWWLISHALTRSQDSLIIGTEAPFFKQLLNDCARKFELVPLISSTADVSLIEAIIADDSPINNVLVSNEQVHQSLLKRLNRDMHIQVVDPTGMVAPKPKEKKVKTRIYIPKVG